MGRFLFVLALAGALLFPAATALGDDTSIGSWGGAARPMQSTYIRMAAETVQCVCYQRFAEYRVDFRFENSGAGATVRLGFPFYVGGDTNAPPASFRAWRDGEPLPVSIERGTDNGEPTDYYVHTVNFPSGATTVTVDYLVSKTSSNIGDEYALAAKGTPYAAFPGELDDYNYTLHTGANWAGTIGTAVLRWTMSPDFVGWGPAKARSLEARMAEAESEPEYLGVIRQLDSIESHFTQPDPRTWQYVLRDFEPTETADGASAYDVGFHFFEPSGWDREDNPTRFASPDVAASTSLSTEAEDYPAEDLVDGDPSTPWAEDVKGPGIGQYVDFAFVSAQDVRELRIVSGYAKRPDLFSKYNRPKRLKVDYSDGTSQIVQLADTPSLQRFPAKATAKSARITILDVYRGTGADQTYLSQVEFGTAAAPKFLPFATLLRAGANAPSGVVGKTDPGAASAQDPAPVSPLVPLAVLFLSVAFLAVIVVLQWTPLRVSASGPDVDFDQEGQRLS
jgi:hypothetical protein